MGNQLSKTDSSGSTTYSYDVYNRVNTVLNPEGMKTSYEYDKYGNIDREEVRTTSSEIISATDYVYNEFNRLDYVIEEKTQKLSKLLISPTTAYVLADQQITFNLTGFIGYGMAITDEILNEAVWTVSSPFMTLSATKGKTVTGMIPKAAWDAMAPIDEIIVRAVLQDKVVEARVYKNVIQAFTINSTETYANANQQLTFTISGTMGNGSVIPDDILNGAVWTVSSPFITLNTTKGETVTGVISKAAWDTMSSTDSIIVRAALNDKAVEARVYKNGIGTLTITPKEVYAAADREMLFILKGTMKDGTDARYEILNETEWTVSVPFITLNTDIKYKVKGIIPKANWDAMSGSDVIIVKATLHDKSAESRVYKRGAGSLQSLSINPTETHALADQQLTFTITGTMNDGSTASDELLGGTTWTVNPSTMTLNSAQGKMITGVIPKENWDGMSPTDTITVTATLQGKVVEAKVYKSNTPILQSLSITPTGAYALADQQITFTIGGILNDGSTAADGILNTANWTVSSPAMTLNAAQGKTVTGVISRTNWDAMSSTDVITVTATLQDKVVEATIRKGVPVLQSISITPSESYVLADQQITFTISGVMTDGSSVSDELLSTAVWTLRALSSATMTLNTTQGKTVIGVISKDELDKMLPMDRITVKATLQDKTVSAEVYKRVPPVLQSLSITPIETRVLAGQQITFRITGTMDDRSAAADELLNTATWTVSSSKMTLNATQGKTVTGVIPKSAWDGMSSTDVITVTATLQDKTASSLVYKYVANAPVLQSLSITPSSAVIMKGQSKTFTLSGLMSDGTAAPDSLLNGASWIASNVFTLGNNVGKTVTVYYGVEISSTGNTVGNDINSQIESIPVPIEKDLTASIGNITAGADISTGLAGFSIENIIAYNQNNIISSIDLALDNEISSTPVDRTTTYFKYDNNGNMIEERVVKANREEISTYRYDDFNQLIEVTNPLGTTTFTHYSSGLRETKRHGEEVTKFYYDGQNVILEETNNSLRARNIYGNGAGPAVRENYDAAGNANNYFYIYNGHGDVVALLDENCNIINDYEYDIYGESLQPDGINVDNPFRYAGQYYDKETGFYYLRARYYDPGLMRFISEDTNKGDVKDPLSLNLYTYCQGNPVSYIDSNGHFISTATGALVGGIVGGVSAAIKGNDILTGIVSGAVSGAIVGAAVDLTIVTGGTGLIAVGAIAVAGGVAGAAGDAINQVGNNWRWGKGTSLKTAAKSINFNSVVKSAAIGTAAGVLTGGTGLVLTVVQKTSVNLYTTTLLSGANANVVTAVGKALIDSTTKCFYIDTATGAIYTISATGATYLLEED